MLTPTGRIGLGYGFGVEQIIDRRENPQHFKWEEMHILKFLENAQGKNLQNRNTSHHVWQEIHIFKMVENAWIINVRTKNCTNKK